jgi:hypothetical protein
LRSIDPKNHPAAGYYKTAMDIKSRHLASDISYSPGFQADESSQNASLQFKAGFAKGSWEKHSVFQLSLAFRIDLSGYLVWLANSFVDAAVLSETVETWKHRKRRNKFPMFPQLQF